MSLSPWRSPDASQPSARTPESRFGPLLVAAGLVDPGLIVLSSNAAEVPTPVTWRVTVQNTTGATQNFSVEVVCAA
jgi:hypothetical protein